MLRTIKASLTAEVTGTAAQFDFANVQNIGRAAGIRFKHSETTASTVSFKLIDDSDEPLCNTEDIVLEVHGTYAYGFFHFDSFPVVGAVKGLWLSTDVNGDVECDLLISAL
jgi:hypothetical protein